MAMGSTPTLDVPATPNSPPPRPPSPSGRRSSAPALVALAVTVIVLVVGTVTLLRDTSTDRVALPASTTVTVAPASTTTEVRSSTTTTVDNPEPLATPVAATGNAAVDAQMTEIARFVEQTRGHPFKTPVKVALADGTAFESRLLANFDRDVPELRTTEVRLKALGLIPKSSDLVTIARAQSTGSVAGFFDPTTKELVVRGSQLSPLTRMTVAHELTHALDDQWFSLDQESRPGDDEATYAFTSLAEGSATWVEGAWQASRPAAEQAAIDDEQNRLTRPPELSALPPEVAQLVESPYSLGVTFVDAVLGGNVASPDMAALDAAFADPPTSTEQLLHIDRYRNRDVPDTVAVPPADGQQVDDGVIGEEGVAEVLSIGLAPATARAAAEGWAGDRYVVWTTPDGRSCLRADVVMHTPDDTRELSQAMTAWRGVHPNATIEERDDRTVRFTSCT